MHLINNEPIRNEAIDTSGPQDAPSAPEDEEFDLTPEMIKAGFYAVAISPGSELLNEEDRPLIFGNIYRAMVKARRL